MAGQRSALYEESAISQRERREAKLYSVFKAVAIVFVLIAAIMLIYTVTFSIGVLQDEDLDSVGRTFLIVPVVLLNLSFAGVGIICWFLKNRFNVSYDYLFVEDELRLTKVFNGRKRKFITTVRADQILKLGWAEKPSFDAAVRGLDGKKPRILTPNREPSEGKEFIYILVTGTLGKTLYVLECRREMLEHLVFAAGRTKLERE